MRAKLALALSITLAACAGPGALRQSAEPVEIGIIAFNDFHGALQPPNNAVPASTAEAAEVRVPAGGAAYFASAVESLRRANPNSAVVSAGDLIGASPLVSALFLDEPTVHAMNLIGLDYNAVGNHELDRGAAELRRMQAGGCEQHTKVRPCRIEPFPGARFRFLSANVRTGAGDTLLQPYGIKRFGSGAREVRVGFVGLTLKEAPTLVTPTGVEGLEFRDEAEAVNALVPRLEAEGADAIVVLIHQGASQPGPRYAYRDLQVPPVPTCETMEGDLMPVLAKLDPAVDLVVSGHTHNSYICDYSTLDPSRRFLVTSAGRNGTLVSDITLSVDPVRGVLARRARNVIVQGEGYTTASGEVPVSDLFPAFPRDPAVAALVARYAAAAAPLAARVVGEMTGPATRDPTPAGETAAGDLIADAQLAATRAPSAGGAQIAFMNGSGVRADIDPRDGKLTFGDIYAAQPFGNSLVVKSLTGAQIRRLLEQQFASGWNSVERPNMLMPSRGLTYSYDLSRPEGQRILDLRLDGRPIQDEESYRVTMNSFLATGGDNFTVFREGSNVLGGPLDLDAFEAYLAASGRLQPPLPNRIRRLDTPPSLR